MERQLYAAFDFGAESGRSILGTLADGRLTIEEIHRFANTPVSLPTGLYWNTLGLYQEILQGLTILGRQRKVQVNGIGIDTWGVDFGLLGRDGALVDLPRHYRDSRNHGMLERTFSVVTRERIFDLTGIQFMHINSLYQLHALHLADSHALRCAERLLFMPDLFTYWLTGTQQAEVSIASTSQFYHPGERRWAHELLDAIGVKPSIMPPIVDSGTPAGPLRSAVAEQCGLNATVYSTAGHDTAAAVAAVPAEGERWCYVSSGTWSLMGVELPSPIINAQSLELNFTNEVGADGRIRLLKNIAGLWILQECRRAWAAAGSDYSYEELTSRAAAAKPFQAVLEPDEFLDPGHMPEKIAAYCERTGQPVLREVGEVARCILESLALSYRRTLERLERLLGYRLEVIHIVGGGSRNELLNQLVADATQRRVVTGPVEATAIGNILVQAIGAGQLSGLEEARAVVRRSFEVHSVEPRANAEWEQAYQRFRQISEGMNTRATS